MLLPTGVTDTPATAPQHPPHADRLLPRWQRRLSYPPTPMCRDGCSAPRRPRQPVQPDTGRHPPASTRPGPLNTTCPPSTAGAPARPSAVPPNRDQRQRAESAHGSFGPISDRHTQRPDPPPTVERDLRPRPRQRLILNPTPSPNHTHNPAVNCADYEWRDGVCQLSRPAPQGSRGRMGAEPHTAPVPAPRTSDPREACRSSRRHSRTHRGNHSRHALAVASPHWHVMLLLHSLKFYAAWRSRLCWCRRMPAPPPGNLAAPDPPGWCLLSLVTGGSPLAPRRCEACASRLCLALRRLTDWAQMPRAFHLCQLPGHDSTMPPKFWNHGVGMKAAVGHSGKYATDTFVIPSAETQPNSQLSILSCAQCLAHGTSACQ